MSCSAFQFSKQTSDPVGKSGNSSGTVQVRINIKTMGHGPLARAHPLSALLTLVMLATTALAAPRHTCPNVHSACTCTPGLNQHLPSITCNFSDSQVLPVLHGADRDTAVSLDTLDLTENHLEELPDDFFQGIQHISNLLLSRNNFSELDTAVLKLKSVGLLDISHNAMETLHPGRLNAVPKLRVLDLSHNHITRLSQAWYDIADDMQYLSTQLQSGYLQHMAVLNLSHNAIDTIADDFFKSMGHLASLDLSHNRLTEIRDHTFHTLKFSLISLNLSHNALIKMSPQSLQHLSHLRELGLAYNTLGDISQLEFPPHLESLDLSHSALTDLNHCQLSTLTDLSNIALSGNDLQCSCQLYLLLTWYQTQHHAELALQDDAAMNAVNWTCSPTVNATTGQHHVDLDVTREIFVSQQEGCEDTESHCHSLDHQEHHQMGSGEIEVGLKVAYSGLDIMTSWTVQENGEAIIDGFRLSYIPEDSSMIVSPVLPHEASSYTITRTEMEKHFRVCLDVMAADMVIVRQVCQMFKDEPKNVVVGILAGVIFLVPCVTAIIWILIKDRQIGKKEGYRTLGVAHVCHKSKVSVDNNTDTGISGSGETSACTNTFEKDHTGSHLLANSETEHKDGHSTPTADGMRIVCISDNVNQNSQPSGTVSTTNGLPAKPDQPTSESVQECHTTDTSDKSEVVINDKVHSKDDRAVPNVQILPSSENSYNPPLTADTCRQQKSEGADQALQITTDQIKSEVTSNLREQGIDNPVFTGKDEHTSQTQESTHL